MGLDEELRNMIRKGEINEEVHFKGKKYELTHYTETPNLGTNYISFHYKKVDK